MKDYSINIVGLSQKTHLFDFELGDTFFEKYGTEFISGGNFKAHVLLDKHETFIDAEFKIKGEAKFICDRSLDPYQQALNIEKEIVFKYGNEEEELSDEIVIISRDRASLDLGQYLYEFIVLSLPMKRLHPRFANENEDENGKMIYSSSANEVADNQVDPRWEKLKKLK